MSEGDAEVSKLEHQLTSVEGFDSRPSIKDSIRLSFADGVGVTFLRHKLAVGVVDKADAKATEGNACG